MKNPSQSTIKESTSKAPANPKASSNKKQGGVHFPLLFGRSNYFWMLVGLAVIVVGNVLMIGTEDIYSFTKITLAPILIMLGFLIEIYAIMHRSASRP